MYDRHQTSHSGWNMRLTLSTVGYGCGLGLLSLLLLPAQVGAIDPVIDVEPESLAAPSESDLAPFEFGADSVPMGESYPTDVGQDGFVEVIPEPAPTVTAPPPGDLNHAPYIDSDAYSLGATSTQPYVPPDEVVLSERVSGCQAVLSGNRGLTPSLCTPDPMARPRSAPQQAEKPVPSWRATPYAYAPRTPASETVPSAPAAPWTPAAADGSGQHRAMATKPGVLNGANPLRWVMPQNSKLLQFPLSVPASITSAFGWRIHPISGGWRFHSGIDLGAPMGTPVLAAFEGRVEVADWQGGYGLTVELKHHQGQHRTLYAHLSEILVEAGQDVEQGTVIGLVGSTGNSTGPHLHFEVLQKTETGLMAVNPGVQLEAALARLVNALQTAQMPTEPGQEDS